MSDNPTRKWRLKTLERYSRMIQPMTAEIQTKITVNQRLSGAVADVREAPDDAGFNEIAVFPHVEELSRHLKIRHGLR